MKFHIYKKVNKNYINKNIKIISDNIIQQKNA